MSITETPPDEDLGEFPAFDLECLPDDPDNPTEVTLFTDGEEMATEWLTVDRRTAVPLENVR